MVIEHQIETYQLEDTVTHNQGNYAAIIADTISRYKNGEPILYYTWTPYWVSGVLVPNKDVVWLEVPFSALPGERKNVDTTLSNGKNYGFEMNSMRIIANKEFAAQNPAAARLFEIIKLNINDVSAQNMMMSKGKNSTADIESHVNGWIKANRNLFDSWINEAKKQRCNPSSYSKKANSIIGFFILYAKSHTQIINSITPTLYCFLLYLCQRK